MRYFDAHCHVQFPEYDADRKDVMGRMLEAEVGGLLVGTALASSQAALEHADGVNFFASAGFHPNHASDAFDPSAFRALLDDPKMVAIGECGLDYYRPDDPGSVKEEQKRIFAEHIKLAVETGKPLMVHARPTKGTNDAYDDALSMLDDARREHEGLKANFHFFVGDARTAMRISNYGFTCSFTAVLTFSKDYDEVIRTLPLTSILAETDSPYVAPAPNRGKRNEPTAVIEVVKAIARIRGDEEEYVRAALLENARKAFGLPA